MTDDYAKRLREIDEKYYKNMAEIDRQYARWMFWFLSVFSFTLGALLATALLYSFGVIR